MKFGESFENLKSSISSKAEINYLNNASKEIAKDISQATNNKKFTAIFRNGGSELIYIIGLLS